MSNTKKKSGHAILYSFGTISQNMVYLLVGQLTYALTTSYSMSALTVGTIFLVSRFLDGFTDLAAGYIIDKLNPKCGKARLYDLFHIPMWICMVLVFSVPEIGTAGKVIWVFLFYNLMQSVIATFLNVSESLRLQRSFTDDRRVKVMTITSMCTMVATFAASLCLPQLIGRFAGQPHGWTIISLCFAIPFATFGTIRFICLPELPELSKETPKQKKVSVWETVKSVFGNKYALLYGGVVACWAMYNTLSNGVVSFYFDYVYGDVSASSIMGFSSIIAAVCISVCPKVVAKIGRTNTVRGGLMLMVLACCGRFLMGNNLIGLFVLNCVAMLGMVTLTFSKQLFNIDNMTYGRWKSGNSIEAGYATITSVADKLGLGLGGVLLGAILEWGGFVGTAEVQTAGALLTIKLLYSLIPAVMPLIAFILLGFYDLEKRLPGIRRDLQERDAQKSAK